jgi:hypothetical protein
MSKAQLANWQWSIGRTSYRRQANIKSCAFECYCSTQKSVHANSRTITRAETHEKQMPIALGGYKRLAFVLWVDEAEISANFIHSLRDVHHFF